MTQPHKPRAASAPETETPERPSEVPEATPRDEEAPLETPEEPLVREEHILRLQSEAASLNLVYEHRAALTFDPEIAELHRHVAQNPVHSHAPAWLGREPNSP